jgi:signal transduction histidine kinase
MTDEANPLFELVFRDSPYGAVLLDASTRMLACNEVARGILGLSDSDAVGKDSFDPAWKAVREDGSILPPDEYPSVRSIRTKKPVRGAVMGLWNEAEGRYRWMRLDAIPRLDPATGAALSTIVWIADITDLILSSEAERRSQGLFSSLFANMTEGVALHEVVKDSSGRAVDYRIIDVNPHYERHVGIPREKAVGRLGSEVYGVSPAPYLDEFCGVAMSGKPYGFETYFPPLDKHFLISVAPLGVGGFATIFFDISESKQFLAERERLLEELERKNGELESIVYVASHDLRSPLVNIQGFGTRLEKDCAELSALAEKAAAGDAAALSAIDAIADERMPRSLEFIRASGRKMDKLISGLLNLSRVGRAQLLSDVLDMGELLAEIISSAAYQLEKAGAAIEVGSLPPCVGDGEQLAQAFSNLIDNAIKYRSKERPLRISVTGKLKGGDVEYVVADNGIGIAKEHLDKIWELFYRLDPNDGAGGDGLGLSLVRRIVERHKGRTSLESEPGAGSRFIVTLPAGTEAGGARRKPWKA